MMNRTLKFKTCLLLITLFLSFESNGQTIFNTPKQVIITGKIDNYDPDVPVKLLVQRLGFGLEQINAKTDSSGSFFASFESYIPTDAFITHKGGFFILTHPGDSLHIRFDGKPTNWSKILGTVKFSGDAHISNQNAAIFQRMYYAHPLFIDQDKRNWAVKHYEVHQYNRYLDTVKKKVDSLYLKFVSAVDPDEESRKWALLYINQDYYNKLYYYPRDHREANNMDFHNQWDVPKGYFQRLENSLPLDNSMLISSQALTDLSNGFNRYAAHKIKGKNKRIRVIAGDISSPANIMDSARIHSTLKHIPDPLLKQIMLTRYFSGQLEKQQISGFEKYEKIVKKEIRLPFLKEPLYQLYKQAKNEN